MTSPDDIIRMLGDAAHERPELAEAVAEWLREQREKDDNE
mgnify:CR=1 FL=1